MLEGQLDIFIVEEIGFRSSLTPISPEEERNGARNPLSSEESRSLLQAVCR